jgi:hypothetical protein
MHGISLRHVWSRSERHTITIANNATQQNVRNLEGPSKLLSYKIDVEKSAANQSIFPAATTKRGGVTGYFDPHLGIGVEETVLCILARTHPFKKLGHHTLLAA